MLDVFTRKTTRIQGRLLPRAGARAEIRDDHERRLASLARLRAAAEKCDLRTDSDQDLFLLAEDEVILLEGAGGEWAELGGAIRDFRAWLPLLRLEDFGFSAAVEHPLEEPNARLRYLHSGVEASAFLSTECGSVYKFYLPREEKRVGSVFGFRMGAETALQAEAEARLEAEQALRAEEDARLRELYPLPEDEEEYGADAEYDETAYEEPVAEAAADETTEEVAEEAAEEVVAEADDEDGAR